MIEKHYSNLSFVDHSISIIIDRQYDNCDYKNRLLNSCLVIKSWYYMVITQNLNPD